MASNYWLKLYHEMLDDPKVMTLRPALRWRFVEALLVAGEMDQEGLLPGVKEYAWRVRCDFETVETELTELVDAGLLSRDDGQWTVTKFAERQAPVSGAERVARLRKQQQKQGYYSDVTPELRKRNESVTKRYTDIDTDTDTDTESNGATAPAAAKRNTDDVPIPDSLNTPEFVEAWDRWKKYRSEIRKPLRPTTTKAQLKKAAEYGAADAIKVIELSIENGWIGLFWERLENGRAAASVPASEIKLNADGTY